MKSILILAYYSIEDPVFKSAVLPYFVDFPSKDFRFILFTYEHDKFTITEEIIKKHHKCLNKNQIAWYQLKWRSGRHKAIKKVLDVGKSIIAISKVIKKNKVDAIYSEGFPGAIIGYLISRVNRVKHYIHTFEPHAEYMLEAGVWSKTSWEYKLLKYFENKIASHASLIFTATDGMIKRLISQNISSDKIHRVPSCIDLEHYHYSKNGRDRIRNMYNWGENIICIAYLGKFGGMYMKEEIFEFFDYCYQNNDRFRFLIGTQENEQELRELISQYMLPQDCVIINYIQKSIVPDYLSAADFGFVAVRQKESKKYCSPIKTGEYLACGLPVIIPKGISDDYTYIVERKLGILLEAPVPKSYSHVVEEIVNWNYVEKESFAVRSKEYISRDRDVKRYKELYSKLF